MHNQEKFQPKLSIRTSMADYRKENWLINLRSMPSIRSKLFLRDGGSDDEASGKTAAFMQITHSPGFKEGNVCKLHFLWIILSAKQHKSSANVMDKPFAELSKLFNVIFGIHFFPIPRVGRCLQNGLMIGTAL